MKGRKKGEKEEKSIGSTTLKTVAGKRGEDTNEGN